MRRYFLVMVVVLSLLLFGCSSDIPGYQSPSGGEDNILSPPSWTIGSWFVRIDGNIISSLTFSSDNVIFSSSGVGIDYKQLSQMDDNSVAQLSSSDSFYSFSVSTNEVTQTLSFSKTSDSSLRFSLNTGGIIQNLNFTK